MYSIVIEVKDVDQDGQVIIGGAEPITFTLKGPNFRLNSGHRADPMYYGRLLDHQVKLETYQVYKYHTLGACAQKNKILIQNTKMQFRIKYEFGPDIAIVSMCPEHVDPWLDDTIKVSRGFFIAGMRLPLSWLATSVLNYINKAPY